MGKYSLENHERYRSVKIRPPRMTEIVPPVWEGPAVRLGDDEALARMHASGLPFALILPVGSEPLPEIGWRIAQAALQSHWRTGPVFVEWASADVQSVCAEAQAPVAVRFGDIRREAVRWHAAGCCGIPGFGSRVELRKASWSLKATAGGMLPVRLWWVSTGTSPCYGSHPVVLRLSDGHAFHDLPLQEDIGRFIEGDDTTNRMIRLPDMPPGRYTVSIGAMGYPLAIGDVGLGPPDGDGFFPLGAIDLDCEPRAWMQEVWNTYYPEGYYPLEDPEVPA